MYGGLGMSAPSLHRESTDSLITLFVDERHVRVYMYSTTSAHCIDMYMYRLNSQTMEHIQMYMYMYIHVMYMNACMCTCTCSNRSRVEHAQCMENGLLEVCSNSCCLITDCDPLTSEFDTLHSQYCSQTSCYTVTYYKCHHSNHYESNVPTLQESSP